MSLKMLASKSTRGFYNVELHGKNIPKDAVKISDEKYIELLEGLMTGHPICFDADGFPFVGELEVIAGTQDEVLERFWRDSELSRSDFEIYKIQDSDPKAVGNISDWREYRKKLRAWPANKDFPNKSCRPSSPHIENKI